MELLARNSEPAPGLETGVNFGASIAFSQLSINGAGQVAFVSYLSDNSSAIFAEDLSGELKLIARRGSLLDVSDDPLVPDLREVESFEFIGGSGNADGQRSAFNERGQLAFTASFTDGTSGVFVSNAVAVPEPAAAILVTIALISAGVVRTRP